MAEREEAGPKDAWTHAQDAVKSFFYLVPPGNSTLGGYDYEMPHLSNREVRLRLKLSTPERNQVRVWVAQHENAVKKGFGPDCELEFGHIVVDRQDSAFALFKGHVEMFVGDTEGRTLQGFPKFSFNWDRDSSGKGRLVSARVFTGVKGRGFMYNRHQGEELYTMQPDLDPAVYPTVLEPDSKINGMPIPWTINYDKLAQNILDTSGIQEFAELARLRYGAE